MSEETLPCISLWQPWAQFVALGWKSIETRRHSRFAGLVGKRIGVHAACKWDPDWQRHANLYMGTEHITQTLRMARTPLKFRMVCTAFVREFRPLFGPVSDYNDQFLAMIECNTERMGLFLMDVKAVQPPFSRISGAQGIFDVAQSKIVEPIVQQFAKVEDFCV